MAKQISYNEAKLARVNDLLTTHKAKVHDENPHSYSFRLWKGELQAYERQVENIILKIDEETRKKSLISLDELTSQIAKCKTKEENYSDILSQIAINRSDNQKELSRLERLVTELVESDSNEVENK